MSGTPYDALQPDARVEEQARRYEEQMGREKAERQKQFAEAERKGRPRPKGKP